MYNSNEYDVVVIGGGFYGCSIALQMREYFAKVLVIEKEEDLMLRASLVNQARVHNGYHYPRNLVTAYRSYVNFPIFTQEFKKCVVNNFTKLYAIANGSKVNAYQFHEMFKGIGTPISLASEKHQNLFNKNLIEEVFLVEEYAFDASILREIMRDKLENAGVAVSYSTEVDYVKKTQQNNRIELSCKSDRLITASHVFNCTYSQINRMMNNSELRLLPMKHELTEMALVKMPEELENVGVTVMDGPFFSTMPYPSKNLHSLSHVRYTPHFSWIDEENCLDGHSLLRNKQLESNFIYMLKDVQRYMPGIEEAEYIESIYEIKTVLLQNEADDGRPILYRENYGMENLYNIMGGKIDNIYDILDRIKENSKFSPLRNQGLYVK